MTVTRVSAAILLIGDELLSGRTQDINLRHLGLRLAEVGIQVMEARIVADLEDEIVSAVNALRMRYDYLFTTGGIGPTHDDITSACIAKAFGVSLERNAEAVSCLRQRYSEDQLNSDRLRMADLPVGAELIDNSLSLAPGFRICNVLVLAGMPAIMHAMLAGVLPQLRSGAKMLEYVVHSQLPEGVIAGELRRLQERHRELKLGSYPFVKDGRGVTDLVLRGFDHDRIQQALQELLTCLTELGACPSIRPGSGDL